MSHSANVVSIHPYFKAKPGKLAEAKAMLPRFVAKTSTEKLVLHYDFTINGDEIHCRESYIGAEGLLAHIGNVGAVLGEFLKITDLTRLEVHGPEDELAKLKSTLEGLKPTWFVYECGVNRGSVRVLPPPDA
jgi:quinol monooxygenase YgiN